VRGCRRAEASRARGGQRAEASRARCGREPGAEREGSRAAVWREAAAALR
jgi:hypothetical protein